MRRIPLRLLILATMILTLESGRTSLVAETPPTSRTTQEPWGPEAVRVLHAGVGLKATVHAGAGTDAPRAWLRWRGLPYLAR